MECWNNGILGSGKLRQWFIGKTLLTRKLINERLPYKIIIPTLQYSLAQTPGPDLACQDAAMESQAFISSENSRMCISRRARAGWLPWTQFVSSACEVSQRQHSIPAKSRQGGPLFQVRGNTQQPQKIPLISICSRNSDISVLMAC